MKVYTTKIINGEPQLVFLESTTLAVLQDSLIEGAIEVLEKDEEVMIIKLNKRKKEGVEDAGNY